MSARNVARFPVGCTVRVTDPDFLGNWNGVVLKHYKGDGMKVGVAITVDLDNPEDCDWTMVLGRYCYRIELGADGKWHAHTDINGNMA